ncbi:hypothetical protein HG531_010828 [Fusarium graminearum]|nr:hypothetical protein HG531_010828 [Fusarium graminearum]
MPSTNFPAGSVEEAVQEAQDLDLTFEKAQAELAKWEAIRDQPAAAQAAIDEGNYHYDISIVNDSINTKK